MVRGLKDVISRRLPAGGASVLRWTTAPHGGLVVVCAALLAALLFASALPDLRKDTSIEAFIPKDHPAVAYRDVVAREFGLSAPMLVVISGERGSIFTPTMLELVHDVTEALQQVPNVDPEGVTSLATVSAISADGWDLSVASLFASPPRTIAEARAVAETARDMPGYEGVLFSADGSSTLIMAELLDQETGAETYQRVLRLVRQMADGQDVRVAGEAVASAYLASYLDQDSKRLLPLGGFVMLVVTWLSFRTIVGTVLPFAVVGVTLAVTVGAMAWLGVPYFVITNALPAILIGIAVADSVHIVSHYYDEREAAPDRSAPLQARRAVRAVWRPVTLTTLTTVAGFLGVAATSSTPPMMWFGVFAMFGICVAYVVSLTLVPAVLSRFAGGQSPAFARGAAGFETRPTGRLLTSLARTSAARPVAVLSLAALFILGGLFGASRIVVDVSIQDQFQADEPLIVADDLINERFAGSNFLDIVVETTKPDGILDPTHLEKVAALEAYLIGLPHVGTTTSIVGPIKRVNQALNEDAPGAFALPDTPNAIAQQLFLLTISGGPREWSTKITPQADKMLVRAFIDSGRYVDARAIVEATERYLAREWQDERLSARLTGPVAVNYHWLSPLAREHLTSLAIALGLVLAVSCLLFRSVAKGTLTIIPVVTSVITVYGVMGVLGMNLNVGTSMFAAIAIGLGVDFAIHIVDRIDHFRANGRSLDEALAHVLPTSGRALLVNFAVLFFGFSVVGFSELPIMRQFGGLVAAAVLGSFVASMTMIPALLALAERLFRTASSPNLEIPHAT